MRIDTLLPGPFGIKTPEHKLFREQKKFLPYFLSDTEKTHYEKCKKELGSDWHYYDKEVTYILNNHNYRTKEWKEIDWKNSIVVFGCSHVFGEGLALDETLCYQLENLFDRPVINLGQSGTSNTFNWHNSLQFYNIFGIPYAVVQVWTAFERFLYYEDDQVKRVGAWSGGKWDGYDKDMEKLFYLWNKNSTHSEMFCEFENMACKDFWSNKTHYFEASYFEGTAKLLNCLHIPKLDDARDFEHSGVKTHKNGARLIYENSNIR